MPKPIPIMTSLRAALCASFLLALAAATQAELLPIKIYTSADGLSSSSTLNLARDSHGFIWICTRDGLIRFDGYRFITYRIGSEDAEPAIFSLLPTRRDVYWIDLNRGTDYRFDASGNATQVGPLQQPAKNDPRIPLLNVQPVTEHLPVFEDSFNNLWSSDDKGLYLMREVEGGRLATQFIEVKLPEHSEGLGSVRFSQGSEGSIWIGTSWGLLRRLPDGRMVHYSLHPQDRLDVALVNAEDREGRVWIGRPEGLLVLKVEPLAQLAGLGNFTARQTSIKNGSLDTEGVAQLPKEANEGVLFSFKDILRRDLGQGMKDSLALKPAIYALLEGSDGKMWFTTSRGLVLFERNRFQHFTSDQGLKTNNLSEIVEDGEGHIWILSYAGLVRLNPKGLTTFDSRDGLAEARVLSIYENHKGEMHVVTDKWKISRFEDGTFKTSWPNLPRGATWEWHSKAAFLDSHGDWWIMTSQKLYRYSGIQRIEDIASHQPTASYDSKNGLLGDVIYQVFEDTTGAIWISYRPGSGQLGLTRWQRDTGKFQSFYPEDGLPKLAYGSAFAEDNGGNLWFGFLEGGISRFRNGRFTLLDARDGIPAGMITSIYKDSRGRLWIASAKSGLSRVDNPTSEHPVFRHYTIADGLTSNNIRCITEDLYGNIYVGTVTGVNRLSPETDRISYYGVADGLASDFVNVAYRDHNGALWFGTFSGLSRLVPEPNQPATPPAMLIGGLRIAGVDYSVAPLGQTDVFVADQSANQNNLQVEFLSVTSGGSDATRYQYRLDGADEGWSTPTTQRTINFANLRPGRYRFLVRAVNADGLFGEKPASITFRILPPIWQRWWFIALAALLVIGSVLALDRYRVARARELKAALTVSHELTNDLTQKGVELGRANRTLALDSDVTQVLSEAETRGEAAPRILQLICERTGWEMGAIWRVDNQTDLLRCVAFWHLESVAAAEFEEVTRASEFQRGLGLPGRVWAESRPLWITDLQTDANFPRIKMAEREGLRSALGFPILLEGEVLGVIEFFSHEPRAYDEEQLQMMSTIGSHLGQLIERKQAEEALRESETRFRTLAETASDAIITIDENSRILFVNTEAQQVFGYEIEEMVGANLTMLMPKYLRHLHHSGFNRYLATGRKHIGWTAVELPGLHKSGHEVPLELSFGEFHRNGQRYFTGIARDITERKRAEAEIRNAREERLRELERVRKRIATDLHDDIGSALTQISILSEVVHRQISDGESPIAGPLSMIANSSRELVDSMSDIVWAINPQKDHLSDLLGRMRRFAADMLSARNIEFQFQAPGSDQDVQLGANIRREVFLIFKESINNMVKHSACNRAEISFAIDQDHLTLKISDNGKGFETTAESDGHGLMSMRDRAAGLGAMFVMTSGTGHGTTMSLDVPLHGKPAVV